MPATHARLDLVDVLSGSGHVLLHCYGQQRLVVRDDLLHATARRQRKAARVDSRPRPPAVPSTLPPAPGRRALELLSRLSAPRRRAPRSGAARRARTACAGYSARRDLARPTQQRRSGCSRGSERAGHARGGPRPLRARVHAIGNGLHAPHRAAAAASRGKRGSAARARRRARSAAPRAHAAADVGRRARGRARRCAPGAAPACSACARGAARKSRARAIWSAHAAMA